MAGGSKRTKTRTTVSARKYNGQTGQWEDIGVVSDSINGQPVTWFRRLQWWWATKSRDRKRRRR